MYIWSPVSRISLLSCCETYILQAPVICPYDYLNQFSIHCFLTAKRLATLSTVCQRLSCNFYDEFLIHRHLSFVFSPLALNEWPNSWIDPRNFMANFARDICTLEEIQMIGVQRQVTYFTSLIIVDQRISIGYLFVWSSGLLYLVAALSAGHATSFSDKYVLTLDRFNLTEVVIHKSDSWNSHNSYGGTRTFRRLDFLNKVNNKSGCTFWNESFSDLPGEDCRILSLILFDFGHDCRCCYLRLTSTDETRRTQRSCNKKQEFCYITITGVWFCFILEVHN